MQWETVIGLEVHVQLATKSKIFSGSSTAFGADANTQASAVDLALPGTLPVPNEQAFRYAAMFGLAIDAEINQRSVFERKNYFYPDLPKGYQISQFATPIVGQGEIKLDLADGSQRVIGITRAHLEEDAGKSVHDLFPGQTGIDLNRTGTPLLEVVSEPDLRSASEAAEYFRQMHSLVKYLGICDGNLAEGSMRCDANVSVRPHGQEAFGERTEIKNINSFRFVERAIELEIERQIDVLEAGGTIHRETRLFDADADETRSMRSKELSEDYRYFPDPDLLPLHISSAFVQAVRDSLPELPDARCQRYQEAMGLSAYDAASLSNDLDRAEFFEAVVSVCNNPKLSANWLNGELSAYLNNADLEIAASPVTAGQLGQLIQRVDDETLSSKTAKELFKALWAQADTESNVDALIEQLGLKQMNDDGELSAIVSGVLEANPDQVAELKSGKDKVLGFLVGQVMKATGGKANPKQVNELIRKNL